MFVSFKEKIQQRIEHHLYGLDCLRLSVILERSLGHRFYADLPKSAKEYLCNFLIIERPDLRKILPEEVGYLSESSKENLRDLLIKQPGLIEVLPGMVESIYRSDFSRTDVDRTLKLLNDNSDCLNFFVKYFFADKPRPGDINYSQDLSAIAHLTDLYANLNPEGRATLENFADMISNANAYRFSYLSVPKLIALRSTDGQSYRFKDFQNVSSKDLKNADNIYLDKLLAMKNFDGTEYRFNELIDILSLARLYKPHNKKLLEKLLNTDDPADNKNVLTAFEIVMLTTFFAGGNSIFLPGQKIPLIHDCLNYYDALKNLKEMLQDKCMDDAYLACHLEYLIELIMYVNALRKTPARQQALICQRILDKTGRQVDLNTLAKEYTKILIDQLTQKRGVKLLTTLDQQQKELLEIDVDKYLADLLINISPLVRTDSREEKTAQRKLFANVLANNDPEIIRVIKNIDFSLFAPLPDGAKPGLPLIYTRENFLRDLMSVLDQLAAQTARAILGKLGITLTAGKTSYDGLLQIARLDQNDKDEKEIYALVHRFLLENRIDRTILTDARLANILDSLIAGLPEFINTIGKQQHGTHAYALDIHILKVLSEALRDPEYAALSRLSRTKLKLTILLHDIMKMDRLVDDAHPETSAIYARKILQKYKLSEWLKDEIYELIKDHHWLADYDANSDKLPEFAVKFRSLDHYLIAKILAGADLRGVNSDFYSNFGDKLSVQNQKALLQAMDTLYSESPLLFTDEITAPNCLAKIPIIEYKGEQYRVINIAGLKDGADAGRIGFWPGSKKEDLRFNIHAVDTAGCLKTVVQLSSNIRIAGTLSQSLISPKYKYTYNRAALGLILSNQHCNIASAANYNIGSGFKKDFNKFIYFKTAKDKKIKKHRNYLPELIREKLGISQQEYAELYKQISPIQYKQKIADERIFQIGAKRLTGRVIKTAISQAQDTLLSRHSVSEIIAYNPKVAGFMARADKIEDIPAEYLEFARENNLPVYLMGQR